MLSLSNGGMSSGQAGRYFAKEDYYLKGGESSQWLGKGAETLGLEGRVEEEAFRNLAAGRSPDGSSQLVAPKLTRDQAGEQVETHRAGNDLTFSAPKSVSVGYAAGNHELKEIWDRAVVNTMDYVEKHYSQYRTPDGVATSGNVVAAKFDHVTSRALDPEVHSHVFLVNVTRTGEKEWKANEPKNIYADKIAIGTLARQEAIRLYREAGYPIRFTDREHLLFEIEGVGERELETFSKRSAAIAEQVAHWKEEKKFPGASDTVLKQMAALDTRDPKRQVTREDVRREWDNGFRTAGTTAQQVQERIQAARTKYLHSPESPLIAAPPRLPPDRHPPENHSDVVIKHASELLTDREAVFDRARLMQTAAQISGGEHSIAELNDAVGNKARLHFLGQELHGWQAGKAFYTTKEMLELEARNVATLRGLGPLGSVTSRPEVEAYLKGLAGERETTLRQGEVPHLAAHRAGAASAERAGQVLLSAGQRECVVSELAGVKGFSVTQGDPGTGKTFAAGVVERFNAEVLEPTGRRHHTLNLAYTGKAALEMELASGKPAQTVDAFLNRYRHSRDAFTLLGTDLAYQKGTQAVIRLDEASFVGGRQAEELLAAVRELRSRGIQVKLSMIGDAKQMQSIQASPFFSHASQLAREGHGCYVVMKEITRQKDAELLEVAKVLNRDRQDQLLGSNAGDALQMLRQQGRVVEVVERRDLVRAAVERYLAESARPSRDPELAAAGKRQSVLVVTPLNADRRDLNESIREARIQTGAVGKGVTVEVLTQVDPGVTGSGYQPGMTVIFAAKHAPGFPANQQGEVLSADPVRNKVTIRLAGRHGSEQTTTFESHELAQSATLYRREKREFAVGDQVVFGKNTRGRSITAVDGGNAAGVRNGERGEIENISVAGGHTAALVRMGNGRRVSAELDRFGPQHIDHGYVVTVHKGQGETVDSVLSFHYVRPASSNEKGSLKSLTRIELTEEQFSRWNSGLSAYEKRYRIETKLGTHEVTVSFVMIADRQNLQIQKGIAVNFHEAKAIIGDEATRLRMREAGLHWVPGIDAWVTAATNDNAPPLMTHHPLKDRQYLTQLKTHLEKGSPFPPAPVSPGERNFTAELDTTTEAARFGHASYNSFNVAVTRARHEAAVFTNSVSGLGKAVQVVDSKTTTVDRHLKLDNQLLQTLQPSPAPPPPRLDRELAKELWPRR